MAFTSAGFTPERYDDIVERIRASLETSLGTPISSDPDSVIGVFISEMAYEIAEQENLNQSQFNNLDIDKAEGVYLDRLAAYLGVTRSTESPSSGQLKVWRNTVGTIYSSVLFSTDAGVEYSAVNGLSHVLTSCNEVTVTPIDAIEGNTYSVTLNETPYLYVALSGDTEEDIITEIEILINGATSLTTEISGSSLTIATSDDDQNSLSVSYSRFSLEEIASYNYCESVETGLLTTLVNTITNVVTANTSILRSNNPLTFTDGTDVETDEELRSRVSISAESTGVATVGAIRGTLLTVSGVSSASVIENRTLVTDGDGRPAKSYECVVVGGNPTDIADTIWETKPAGTETYGNTSNVVLDWAGDQQTVNWSRPEEVYVHVRVTYTKYDEEIFPDEGEEAMTETIVTSGNLLGLGVDVIPSRFVGELHRAVQGLDSILVEVGTSASPVAVAPDAWQTTSISIADNQYSAFASGRVTLIDNT